MTQAAIKAKKEAKTHLMRIELGGYERAILDSESVEAKRESAVMRNMHCKLTMYY